MKKFLLSFIIPILTFGFGVYIYRISTPNVSLETISNYTQFYDGMNVEIETYAQLLFFDENDWSIGEMFEKPEAATYLNLENNPTNLANLQNQLKENLTENHYKRAKVLVRGKVKDNCGGLNFGKATCCFGRSITIQANEVIQLAPVEDYTRPE